MNNPNSMFPALVVFVYLLVFGVQTAKSGTGTALGCEDVGAKTLYIYFDELGTTASVELDGIPSSEAKVLNKGGRDYFKTQIGEYKIEFFGDFNNSDFAVIIKNRNSKRIFRCNH